MTDNQLKDLILATAKDNPAILTSALREAGNFCYLVVPADIEEYINNNPEDFADLKDLADEEIKRVVYDYRYSLGDCVDYNGICSVIVDAIRCQRNRKKS